MGHAIDQNLPVEVAGLSDNDRLLIRELCEALPEAIAALMDTPDGKRPPAPSAVIKPTTALKGELREASIAVTDARAKGKAMLATAIGTDGARILSERPFQEWSMAHLNIEGASKPLSVWVNVLLCVPELGQLRVEVQLFAPSKELRADWLALYRRDDTAASANRA
ncbi:MAG: hypothetical protein ABI488_12025 [Polyangiaceae bacterium]